MHPEMASALASQHRHEMNSKASSAARVARAGETAEARQAGHDGGWRAAASPRGPRRGAHLRGGLLPRYRVSWSRTALSATAADGAGRGHSWVIVISATRTL